MNQDEITKMLSELREQGRRIAQDIHGLKLDVKNLNAFRFKAIGTPTLEVKSLKSQDQIGTNYA